VSTSPDVHADGQLQPATPEVTLDPATGEVVTSEVIAVEIPGAEDAVPVVTARSEQAASDRARARALFAEMVSLPEGSPERHAIRDQLVETHLPLVEYLARRFRNRGELHDDLVQVATIGLIKSVDRFDLERGVEFSTYATPATRAGRSAFRGGCRSSSSHSRKRPVNSPNATVAHRRSPNWPRSCT
jgi:hypothetical protein